MKTILLMLVLLFISCTEQTPVNNVNGNNNNETSFFRIEIEPSLSFDRNTLLMVRADTLIPSLNGIYSAQVNNPIRTEEYLRDKIISPTLGVNTNVMAFLRTSKLYFYDKLLDTSYISSLSQSFQMVIFLNDTMLIGEILQSIVTISYPSLNISTLAEGFLPAIYRADTIAYLNSFTSSVHIIHLATPTKILSLPSVGGDIAIDTIFASRPKSFSIEPNSRRYCYSLWNGQNFDIYSGGSGNETDKKIAESDFSGVIMLNANSILFTGNDGRLYETDFLGKISIPYWAAVNSDY